jgi:hydrogenase maturation protease
MKQTVVLGIGNRLMSDDGIGVRIAEALERDGTIKGIRFAAGETDIGYCLDELAEADVCIIVDAACFGNEPCSVNVFDLPEVLEQKRPARSFHEFDLIHAMKINNIRKEGILITVEVCSVEFSSELSPEMQERLEEIIREVKMIIATYLLDC